MGYIQIGFGIAAGLHMQKFADFAVIPVGVIESDEEKHGSIAAKGLKVCKTYQYALQLNPNFWDITAPNEFHFTILEKIIKLDPTAHILVEKPLCEYAELAKIEQLLEGFKGKIVVNENYLSSLTTRLVKKKIDELGLKVTHIFIEMSKNRSKDIQNGRYLAKNAFYYEGPHMLTILKDLVDEGTIENVERTYEDFEVAGVHYPQQGSVDISFRINQIAVNLFTSMKGDIKHRYPRFTPQENPVTDASIRYRIAAVEGIDPQGQKMTVVGYYEPIQGFKRSQSAVVVYRGTEELECIAPIPDDTMGNHLKAAVDYFDGKGENPCPVEKGVEIVQMMDLLAP